MRAVGAPTAAVLVVDAGEEPEACEGMALAVGAAVGCMGVTTAGVVRFAGT